MPVKVMKVVAKLAVILLVCVTAQAYWISYAGVPQLLRSTLAIAGGMAFGFAVSHFFILWIESETSID